MTQLTDTLKGMTTPLVTPFEDGAIDWEAYDRLLTAVTDGGIDTVFTCGTTGEFASLSSVERRRLVERTVRSTPDDVTVLVGGTGTAVEESIDWIKTAAEAGVDGVVVTAPYFHTSNGSDGIRRFFECIADRSALPVVVYNIPACVGESIPVGVVAELATHDSIMGFKDSSGDLAYGLRVQRRVPKEFCLLQGYDPLVLPSLRTEFDGGVNALSNVFPSAYVELVENPASDRARDIHREAIEPLFDHCREDGFAPATKAGLTVRGVLPSNEVRPPLVPIDTDAVRSTIDHAKSVLP